VTWPMVGQRRIDYQPGFSMRVPDQFLKCVAFIAEVIHVDTTGADLDHQATGFIVSVPSALPGTSYPFFVTAKHTARALVGRSMCILVNDKKGGVAQVDVMGHSWFMHPSDPSVDVAVIPCVLNPQLDVISVGTAGSFLTKELLKEKRIGIGDEVFAVGLFAPAAGAKRNMPIVRHGNIAMLPDEPIQVESGFAEVYLIEARSIGGLSGSPVFVRQTLAMDGGPDRSGRQRSLCGTSSECLLLGLVHGHWDIRESDLNKPSFVHDSQRGVNLGIAVVVPAHKILEVIHQPAFERLRGKFDSEIKKGRAPRPDGI
jgi:hypothetical protein